MTFSASSLPLIAITMGDPAGIGPEICLRLLADPELAGVCVPLVVGDAGVLRRAAETCDLPFSSRVIEDIAALSNTTEATVLDLRCIDTSEVTPGQANRQTGQASYRCVETAVSLALKGRVAAVVTGPINKEAWHRAGVTYPGHTEMLAALTGSERYCMMLSSAELTCGLVTTHVGFRNVADRLDIARILDTIELTAEATEKILGHRPRLAVCGLNPHAGEHGLFGTEEQTVIEPAVNEARNRGVDAVGPLAPDTAFLPSRRAVTDAYICMYHDQGLLPLKMLGLETVVNVTLGLPIVRTSVGHGTALDIAWQGKAHPASLLAAVRLAAKLAAE